MTTIISIEDFFLRLKNYKPSKNLRNYNKAKFLKDCKENYFSLVYKYDYEEIVELIGKLDYKQINYIIRCYKFDFYVSDEKYRIYHEYQQDLIKNIIKLYVLKVYPDKYFPYLFFFLD